MSSLLHSAVHSCRMPVAFRPAGKSCQTTTVRNRKRVVVPQAVAAKQFLEDCTKLGKIRFIVVGEGAILETVSEFARLRYADIPNRGLLATVSSEDKSFECHINLSKVKGVKLAKSKAKAGDYDIYATRFVDDQDQVKLTCLLHGSAGQYDSQALEAWNNLQQKYGTSVQFDSI